MLTDVLRALEKSRAISDVTVVSADPEIPPIARRYGARMLWETKRRGLNSALKTGIEYVARKKNGPVMIIHADLPLLTPRDISQFISLSKGYDVVVGPCKDNTGTNALFMRKTRAIPLCFGRGSFRKHATAARERKLRFRIVRIEGIQFDVDEPMDLRSLTQRRIRSTTQRFLRDQRFEGKSKAI
jgi:2-phospho-L-lactate guanylyltransferase